MAFYGPVIFRFFKGIIRNLYAKTAWQRRKPSVENAILPCYTDKNGFPEFRSMRILVTNDDGIRAPGLASLARAMKAFGEVAVCAPEHEQSAVGRALTMHRPLRFERVDVQGLDCPCWCVDGTPTDCVKIAIDRLFDGKPDMVVSGINRGANLGTDVLFSGTVSAAMEGALQGVRSIAVSLGWGEAYDFEGAAPWAAKAVEAAAGIELPFGTMLNVNIPQGRPKGVRVARLGVLDYGETYVEREDPRGRKYYWLAGDKVPAASGGDQDDAWLQAGYMTITPLKFDLTDNSVMEVLEGRFNK
jgi:5'-nucleotidase